LTELDRSEFWQWAYADLLSNAQRGVLAEFIVGKALNCLKENRVEWDAYDLITEDGMKIEVKSAAYVQSWKQERLSDLRFDIAQKQSWFAETNTFGDKLARSADVYVFCVLAEKDRRKINPLDLRQWFFMVISSEIINDKFPNQKTVGLPTLMKVGVRQIAFEELAAEIRSAATVR